VAFEGETVQIKLPVDARFAKTLRLAVSSLATLGDFTLEEIEDLKIAVEEAFLMSVDRADAPEELQFDFTLFDDRLQMRVGTLPAGSAQAEGESERQREYGLMILRAVVSEATFVETPGGSELVMQKRKEREA